MTEQNSKGIALVILGIVAIIAIVGLVLLFTGAKKSTGEFVVPVAKEYGGEIKGVASPYDRAFVGRAYDYPSGVENTAELSAHGEQGETGNLAGSWKAYGENEATMGQGTTSYALNDKRQQQQVASYGAGDACQGAAMSVNTLEVKYPELKGTDVYTEYWSDKNTKYSYTKDGMRHGTGPHGEDCIAASDWAGYLDSTSKGAYSMGNWYELGVQAGMPGWCCINVGLNAEGGSPYYQG